MSENMNAVVGVIVDNCALIASSLVVLLVTVSVAILWTRKRQTNPSETLVNEFLIEDSQPRSKKSAKQKPKKTKAEKVKASIANGHLPNMPDVSAIKMSPDASKSHNVSPTDKQQKSQAVKQKTNKKQSKSSPKADTSEYEAGEWTEVPSRKKPKAKRDGPELIQEPATTNEQTDQPQQESQATNLVESASSPDDQNIPDVQKGSDDEAGEKSSAAVDEVMKDENVLSASVSDAVKMSRTAEKKARKQKAAAAAAAAEQKSLESEKSLMDMTDDKVMVQENEPTENSSGDVEAVNIYPACSTKVPVPESNVTEPKTSPAPEPIEPIENMSIPAAAVKSKIAFDELADDVVPVAVNKRKKKARRDN